MVTEIDISRFKVVHNDRVYNAVALVGIDFGERNGDVEKFVKPVRLRVIVINEDGNLLGIDDEAWMFQFLPRY